MGGSHDGPPVLGRCGRGDRGVGGPAARIAKPPRRSGTDWLSRNSPAAHSRRPGREAIPSGAWHRAANKCISPFAQALSAWGISSS